MSRPEYLKKYLFDWELFDVIIGGKSALDAHSFLGPIQSDEQIDSYMADYGFDPSNVVLKSELFGTFQEALQFIKRYFLKEGNSSGLDYQIPNSLYTITEMSDLFKLATGSMTGKSFEDYIWGGIVLKVMHTILHADKDIRTNYFSIVQQQIFDRFYRFLHRDEDNNLFLRSQDKELWIELEEFETKSTKSRDSTIIKLLHKAENVAEELFDRIGLRFITKNRLDALRVVKFLSDYHLIIPHNIKPSRSMNTIIDLDVFKPKYKSLIKMSLRNSLTEERFIHALEREAFDSFPVEKDSDDNEHTSSKYRSLQFTCRQLIQYKNPFYKSFLKVRKKAKEEDSELAQMIKDLDTGNIAKEIRFFYPFEVQVVDMDSHRENMEGEAAHKKYKKSQLKSATNRLFKPLIEYHERQSSRNN